MFIGGGLLILISLGAIYVISRTHPHNQAITNPNATTQPIETRSAAPDRIEQTPSDDDRLGIPVGQSGDTTSTVFGPADTLTIKNNTAYLNAKILVDDIPRVLGFATSTNGQYGGLDYVGSADEYRNIAIAQEKDQFALIYERHSKASRNTPLSETLSAVFAVFSAHGHLVRKFSLGSQHVFDRVLYLDHTRAYISALAQRDLSYAGVDRREIVSVNDVYLLDNARITKIARDLPVGELSDRTNYSPDGNFFAYQPLLYDITSMSTPGIEGCGLGSPETMSEVRLLDFAQAKDISVVRDLKQGFIPAFWSASSSELYILEGHGVPTGEAENPSCYAGDENFLVYTMAKKTIYENEHKDSFGDELRTLCGAGKIVDTSGARANCGQSNP